MTNIKQQITSIIEARDKATQGKAEVYRMDSDCGYFNFMLEILKKLINANDDIPI